MLPLTKTGLKALRQHVGDIEVEIKTPSGFVYRVPVTKKAALALVEEADGNLSVCRMSMESAYVIKALH